MYNNYYPYYNYIPNNKSNFKRHNWSSILNGAQKTLNFVNQVIPIIYQLKPLYNNAKTAFKVANIIKTDSSNTTNNEIKVDKSRKIDTFDRPTYFL